MNRGLFYTLRLVFVILFLSLIIVSIFAFTADLLLKDQSMLGCISIPAVLILALLFCIRDAINEYKKGLF